ncbi:MAG: triose-phosphate isomerase [Peptococcaceae bacterium]|nr:triose-phosphate isomerase [Peptococcaceae bacterium]
MERKPLIAGNWKMYKTLAEAREFAKEFAAGPNEWPDVDVVICPPYTALAALQEALEGSAVMLGAQDMFHEKQGAYTGEISAGMLKELSCRFVIIGHSERREHIRETDESISLKVHAALSQGLTPILCVGENLKQREQGKALGFVRGQVEKALVDLSSTEMGGVVIAYEPIWAIGTGKTATSEEAGKMCQAIRTTVAGMAGGVAQEMRILYGGSVNKGNIAELMRESHIDGALVGGASLKAAEFREIIQQAR